MNRAASDWADSNGWSVVSVVAYADGFAVRIVGPLPIAGTEDLRADLDAAGVGDQRVTVELVPEERREFGPTG